MVVTGSWVSGKATLLFVLVQLASTSSGWNDHSSL